MLKYVADLMMQSYMADLMMQSISCAWIIDTRIMYAAK